MLLQSPLQLSIVIVTLPLCVCRGHERPSHPFHKRQPRRDGGMHPPKFPVGEGYITIPQYGWLTGQPSGPQHKSRPSTMSPSVDSTSSSFTSFFKISISLGVRPLDPLLGLRSLGLTV